MYHSEIPVMTLFNLGATIGLGSALFGIARNISSAELTPNITAAFLMSISGNCARILAKPDAFLVEKIIISAAVLSYSFALFGDCNKSSALMTENAKLLTTGCVGLWNALQIIRLHPEMRSFLEYIRLQNPTIEPKTKIALAAFNFYCLGAVLGYSSTSIGLLKDISVEKLAPFITFAFLMSHWGNLVRTEFNPDAYFFEKNSIRIAVFFYSIALCCDFVGGKEEINTAAAYTKLTAAGFVGLWNTVLTYRLNSSLFETLGASYASMMPSQPYEGGDTLLPVHAPGIINYGSNSPSTRAVEMTAPHVGDRWRWFRREKPAEDPDYVQNYCILN